ncbi:MESP1 protein, partial [Piaya cayana]|nr:MESP1 protein [Piaya cayana]
LQGRDGALTNTTSPTASAEPPGTSPCPPRGLRHGRGGKPGRCVGLGVPGRRGGSGGPRQSASEREKLRMRRLARALLRLRHYLPPTLAPAGQSLTKIETLRLATRYITHLSALLGLSQEAPAAPQAPRHCPLCPQGLGCCQPPNPLLRPPSPGSVGWGSPPMAGGQPHEAPVMGPWRSPQCDPAAGTPPELHGACGMGREAWGSPPYVAVMGTPLELHRAPVMGTGPWGSPHCDPAVGTPPELHGAPGMRTSGSSPCTPVVGIPAEVLGVLDMGTAGWGSPSCAPAMGTPLELHRNTRLSSAPCAAPLLPSCPPAQLWGWRS